MVITAIWQIALMTNVLSTILTLLKLVCAFNDVVHLFETLMLTGSQLLRQMDPSLIIVGNYRKYIVLKED